MECILKRFVTYLYEYTGAKKGRNTGFVKVDLRGDNCRMELHVRNLNGYTGKGTVFLILTDSGLTGVEIGELAMNKGQGDYGTIFKMNPIGETPYGFDQIAGVGIQYDTEKMIASKWKEDPNLILSMKDIHMWKPQQMDEMENVQQTNNESKQERSRSAENEQPVQSRAIENYTQTSDEERRRQLIEEIKKAVEKDTDISSTIPESEVPQPLTTPTQATEQELRLHQQNIFPEDNWNTKWEELRKKSERVPFRQEQNGNWIKIDVKGIRELPKRNWYLGNNSFLLHGFFNYHYLLLGEEETEGKNRWYLGIPGFYQQQERVMATIFGFPEFFPATGTEQFGYWIHTLDI